MAYSTELADRIRDVVTIRDGVVEGRMFGAVVWMLRGNLACGAGSDGMLVRVPRDELERVLLQPHVGPMEMKGRRMGGFVVVAEEGVADDAELRRWIEVGAETALALPPK